MRFLTSSPETRPHRTDPAERKEFFARHRAWLVTLEVGVLVSIALLAMDIESVEWLIINLSFSVLVVALFSIAIARMPPGSRTVWMLLGGFLAFWLIGDCIYNFQYYFLGLELEIGIADIPYFAGYVCAFAALLVMVQRLNSNHNEDAWTDSLILSLAGTGFVFTVILPHSIEDSPATTAESIVAIAYPLLSLAVLAALIRLLAIGLRPNLSVVLMTIGFLSYTVGDMIYNSAIIHHETWWAAEWMETLYILGATFMLSAILAPGAHSIAVPPPVSRTAVGSKRVIWLAAGVLSVPIMAAFVVWQDPNSPVIRILSVISLMIIALVLWRARGLLRIVESQSAQLARQARTDALTGLPNRRTLNFELARTHKDFVSVTIAMLDLDRFKEYNDTFGHQAADDLLAESAAKWSQTLGPKHFLARYGGEEFCAVIYGLDEDATHDLLDRVREATPGDQTVSVGFSVRGASEDPNEPLRRADEAMYIAKKAGRDRVVAYDDIPNISIPVDEIA